MTSKYFYNGSILMERKIIESVVWKRLYFLIAAVHFYAMNSYKADGKIENETKPVT
jgi:hypothetical protein